MNKKWYIIQVYSGKENKAREELEICIKKNNIFNDIGRMLIPTEEIIEIKSGKKKKSKRKFFPGYILIEMNMNNNVWHIIKNISQIIGFVGGGSNIPSIINKNEINVILNMIKEGIKKPKPKILFKIGESVRIIEGPFSDFDGLVEEVNYSKNRLKVAVLIFGRATPINLDFSQIEKI